MSAQLFFDDEQTELLREMLDFVPLTPRYIPFIADLLGRLPESVVAPQADSGRPAPFLPTESGRRFTLVPHTPKAAMTVDVVNRMLAQVES